MTARLAYLDYSDPHIPVGPHGQLVGIQLPQATFGVNWYLADRLRVMFNYSHVQPSEPNTAPATPVVCHAIGNVLVTINTLAHPSEKCPDLLATDLFDGHSFAPLLPFGGDLLAIFATDGILKLLALTPGH